jgi:hypothetical protein
MDTARIKIKNTRLVEDDPPAVELARPRKRKGTLLFVA